MFNVRFNASESAAVAAGAGTVPPGTSVQSAPAKPAKGDGAAMRAANERAVGLIVGYLSYAGKAPRMPSDVRDAAAVAAVEESRAKWLASLRAKATELAKPATYAGCGVFWLICRGKGKGAADIRLKVEGSPAAMADRVAEVVLVRPGAVKSAAV